MRSSFLGAVLLLCWPSGRLGVVLGRLRARARKSPILSPYCMAHNAPRAYTHLADRDNASFPFTQLDTFGPSLYTQHSSDTPCPILLLLARTLPSSTPYVEATITTHVSGELNYADATLPVTHGAGLSSSELSSSFYVQGSLLPFTQGAATTTTPSHPNLRASTTTPSRHGLGFPPPTLEPRAFLCRSCNRR